MEELPTWIAPLFILCCGYTLFAFHLGNGRSWLLTALLIGWTLIHGVLAKAGFYQDTMSMPPRFALIFVPNVLFIIYGCLPKNREWLRASRNSRWSSAVHIVRIPVEIILWQLALHKWVPELMTFEGRNFDILVGISAILVTYLIAQNKISRKALIAWNYIGLFFVLFILGNGILSTELPFQQFAFDQPNKAITFFPYALLPGLIVPVVIWSHISDIILLNAEKKTPPPER